MIDAPYITSKLTKVKQTNGSMQINSLELYYMKSDSTHSSDNQEHLLELLKPEKVRIHNRSALYLTQISSVRNLVNNNDIGDPIITSNYGSKNSKSISTNIASTKRTQVSGLLESMNYLLSIAEIRIKDVSVTVNIPKEILNNLGNFFGKNILLIGLAKFNVNKQLVCIDAQRIEEATQQHMSSFNKVPQSASILPSIAQLRKEQNYSRENIYNIKQLAKEMAIEEPFQELLEQLDDK